MIMRSEWDARNEEEVMAILSDAWGCEVHDFGGHSVIDFYAVRNDRISAVMELKCRSIASDTYAEVFLAMRKWLDLSRIAAAFDVAALFVIRFTDGIRYINLNDVDPRNHVMGGNSRKIAYNDYEPMILVPVDTMVPL